MKKLITLLHGFCMALADSVPGVSGGTIAFLMGFRNWWEAGFTVSSVTNTTIS